jgi:cytidylate kinase
MGSVVFPNADLKIFLTASAETRAERRFKELQLLGKSVKIEAILQDIILRDRQDSERIVAPLRFTHEYKLLDSTNLSIDECVKQVILWYKQLV